MNIYVGNLSREVTEENLREAFEAFGKVASVTVIKDKFSGESRGFGFVEMPAKAEAQSAMTGLEGKEVKGRTLKVNEARPRSESPRGGRGPRRDWGSGGGPGRGGGRKLGRDRGPGRDRGSGGGHGFR